MGVHPLSVEITNVWSTHVGTIIPYISLLPFQSTLLSMLA